MIHYTKIQRYTGNDYYNIPGFSHSFLKHERGGISENMAITDNMKVGSMVDAILTEPALVSMSSEIYPYCRDIASKIRHNFNDIIIRCEKQVAFTAEMQYNEFKMPTKGKLDYLLPHEFILDLKITKSKDIQSLIKYMGYENQIWHYAKLAEVTKAYIMIYSIPLKKTEILPYDCTSNNNPFWENKILKFGTV